MKTHLPRACGGRGGEGVLVRAARRRRPRPSRAAGDRSGAWRQRPKRGVAARARGGSLASLPPSRVARRRRPHGPLALGTSERGVAEEARAGHGGARARGGGLASLPPSRAAGRRGPGSARARGGKTSGATREQTLFVVPAQVPLNPAGAAPSVEIWRTSPTRIISEYSFGVQPVPSSTPIQTPQKRVEPIRVGPNLPTKYTVRLSCGSYNASVSSRCPLVFMDCNGLQNCSNT